MILTDIAESIGNILTTVIIFKIAIWLCAIAVVGLILFFVIRATCNYQGRRNAEEFDYDYLAERTAEEVCKRMMIIENHKVTAHNETTNRAMSQSEPEPEDDQEK